MTAPYTPQQNGISEKKNIVLKEMVNSMLSYSGLSQEFWGEAMAVVRLPDPKLKTLGERGIECIFVGYAEHFKAFRFYVIEPNDSVAINSIIDTYAPLTRISTIRLLFAMASIHSLIIHQIDVKTAFLNGELEEEVYMNQSLGFIMPVNENKVCKLIKSLYGLKQALK
ncbi:zinc finger, CCHC-type containing protein [Tanacetum coccineum]